ncbi:MAG: hypothetical protein JG769_1068 [Oscillospiraceae bacterium]|jgi:hypothetical protein|nr:hypothetical protein [Oscillospiraceae bacterium]
MNKKSDILYEINKVIQETTSYDFPFLANESRKAEIIDEFKIHIEEQLKQLAPELWPTDVVLTEAWNESLEYVKQKFESLPPMIKINGFYLQELMHFYSEKLGQIILSKTEEV